MDEGRRRVIGIMAAILSAMHMQRADDLFGITNGTPDHEWQLVFSGQNGSYRRSIACASSETPNRLLAVVHNCQRRGSSFLRSGDKPLDRLGPLLEFLFRGHGHSSARPGEGQIAGRSNEERKALSRTRVPDVLIKSERLCGKVLAHVKQYQIVEMGSPQASCRLEAFSGIDQDAVTAQDASSQLARGLAGVDEENLLVFKKRASTKRWWPVHMALPGL